MYSAIPVKCLNWTKENLRHAMLFFPVVGILCAAGTALLWMICQLLHCKALLFAVLAVTGMVFLTGGIHLDGFCDTADALYSRRPQEEKLRILKDPNCGPFAVFSVILVFLLQTAAYDTLTTIRRLSIYMKVLSLYFMNIMQTQKCNVIPICMTGCRHYC